MPVSFPSIKINIFKIILTIKTPSPAASAAVDQSCDPKTMAALL
jgi:hypothetical protein